MTKIQEKLLDLLEKEEETDIQPFIKYINSLKILENLDELNSLLHLISQILNNHHRTLAFTDKIIQILSALKNNLKKFFSNHELFTIFRKNKRILLFLIEEKLLIPDQTISNIICSKKYLQKKYPHYFLPEFKPFFSQEFYEQISIESDDLYEKDPESFKQKRRIGENSSILCELIRQDSIEDFISYVNQTMVSLSNTRINTSIFETNRFLLKKNPTIIEYSAFYGSIQIFKYLHYNHIELTPSLWLYSIHSNLAEMINFLEMNFPLQKDAYADVFIESMKCHHNYMKNYIENTCLNDNLSEILKSCEWTFKIMNTFNYESFPSTIDEYFDIRFFITCHNFPLFQMVMKNSIIDLNEIIIENYYHLSPLQYGIYRNSIEFVLFCLKQENEI